MPGLGRDPVRRAYVDRRTEGLVRTIRSVINPDKLRHLGPVADVRALFRQAGQTS
jgi:hypothetical protein